MSNIVINAENIGKKYRIGIRQANPTLRDAIMNISNLPKKITGKIDKPEEFWALKNVSFEVNQGDVVGIIGRNGSGKSTLLKILSRITEPTDGQIMLKGRVASLLEVGTGFNPELTGRENIFLNGSILGMTRQEIRKHFDEIVEFSGVEKFLDTPVKRYSSGMYVRLAFAVAAHLESEILLIDEVLAVGDAEFQKKCLGKMGNLAKSGRTVLFVSHNMLSMKSFCHKAILLNDGCLIKSGDSVQIVEYYLNQNLCEENNLIYRKIVGNDDIKLINCKIIKSKTDDFLSINKPFIIESTINCTKNITDFNFSLHLYSSDQILLFATPSPKYSLKVGTHKIRIVFPENYFNDNNYYISLMLVHKGKTIGMADQCLSFQLKELKRDSSWQGKWPGIIRPYFDWKIQHYEKTN